MYDFSIAADIDAFNRFSEENGGSVYQTSFWASVKSAWKPYYYMGYSGKTPVLSCLCLERRIPAAGKLWYCPDGFVCDYKNAGLISEFTAYIRKEMKRHGVFALVCDPLIIKKLNGVEHPEFAGDISAFTSAGFKPFAENGFYVVQPPITINIFFTENDVRLTPEALLKKCEKGVRHGVKLGEEGGLKCESYTIKDIDAHPGLADEFFSIMTETSDRVSFIQREKSYYINMLRSLDGYGVMDLIYYDIAGENAKFSDGTCSAKDTERFEAVKKELSEAGIPESAGKFYVACGLTSYFGKTSICLYGGTRNILRNTLRPTHLLNWIRICRSMEKGCEVHDMGRITGDAYDESNPLFGLCRYKQSYGGTVTEYAGDLYLINNKFGFFLFTKVFPFAKKLKNTVLKKTIKKRTVERA